MSKSIAPIVVKTVSQKIRGNTIYMLCIEHKSAVHFHNISHNKALKLELPHIQQLVFC